MGTGDFGFARRETLGLRFGFASVPFFRAFLARAGLVGFFGFRFTGVLDRVAIVFFREKGAQTLKKGRRGGKPDGRKRRRRVF
jgi:hypothetical protein